MTDKEALQRLQNMCSRQERCTYDILRKLNEWEIPDEKAEFVLNELISGEFVDDQRYAKAFVNDKFRFNHWGRIKIAMHLRQKDINELFINTALDEISDEEYEQFVKNELLKKRKTLHEKSIYHLKSKLIRFGQSKGIEFEEIMKAIGEITKPDD